MKFRLLLFVMCLGSTAHADWTLTTVDFQRRRVALESIDATQLAVITNGGEENVSLDKFLQLRRDDLVRSSDRSASTPLRWIARLSDGERIAGVPSGTSGETIDWRTSALGDLKLSMRKIVSIQRSDRPVTPRAATEPAADDVVHLANGDLVHGVISEVTAASVSIQPAAGGDAASVPLDSVIAIDFAETGDTSRKNSSVSASTAPGSSARFRIALDDSTVVNCHAASLERGSTQLKLSGFAAGLSAVVDANIPAADVASIEQIDGPVIWLSSLAPSENVQTSFLDLAWPARFDRSVTGAPIEFADRSFEHGIGVHAYSRLAFPISDSSLVAFRTQYAIDTSNTDSDRSLADVTVRIKLDGKVVHEQQHVRAGAISPVIVLPLDHAKSITLEVDFGDNQDVQDRFNWIEPALLRFEPDEHAATSEPAK